MVSSVWFLFHREGAKCAKKHVCALGVFAVVHGSMVSSVWFLFHREGAKGAKQRLGAGLKRPCHLTGTILAGVPCGGPDRPPRCW